MNTFLNRLKSLWPEGAKPSDFYNKIGMSASGFNRVWKEGAIPTADYLIKIQEVTDCNLHWLLTGQGVPFPNNEEKEAPAAQKESFDVLGRKIDPSKFIFIPFYQDLFASAGYGHLIGQEEYNCCLAFRKDYISQITPNIEDLSVITVRGDSMAGTFNNSDLILVNHSKTTPADGLYVIRIGDELFVKLIQRFPKKILVKSTNPQYEPFEIDLTSADNELTIIGKVEWLGRTVS